jgi:hypothetical protein
MGPTGTVVSFPHAVGLPSIFDSKPHRLSSQPLHLVSKSLLNKQPHGICLQLSLWPSSYPPPREKCAGPECTNAYKYRHSKLNLALCSLKCYKAVQGNAWQDSGNIMAKSVCAFAVAHVRWYLCICSWVRNDAISVCVRIHSNIEMDNFRRFCTELMIRSVPDVISQCLCYFFPPLRKKTLCCRYWTKFCKITAE